MTNNRLNQSSKGAGLITHAGAVISETRKLIRGHGLIIDQLEDGEGGGGRWSQPSTTTTTNKSRNRHVGVD